VKCDIGFWISIQVTLTFLLDFQNALLLKHNIGSLMPFPRSFSFDFENALLPKRNINSLISFPHYFSLDIVSTKRQKVPMDVRRRVLLPSIYFPSTTLMTNSTMEVSAIEYFKFKIWPIFIKSRISVPCFEFQILIGKIFCVLDPMA